MDVPPDRVEQILAPKTVPVDPAVVAGVVPDAAAGANLAAAPAVAPPVEAQR
jgi:hypothetical protein